MDRSRPGITPFCFIALCVLSQSAGESARAAEPLRTRDGWYSSGLRRDERRTERDDNRSLPARRHAVDGNSTASSRTAGNSSAASNLDEQIPTPIVPYHSTLYGSSRTDLPSVPAPPAQQTSSPYQTWNPATPPVVDLGADFGVAARRNRLR
ncbi:MAG: hypothetical protein QM775_06215 [Pirellulales bacterium]